jgi:TonB-like protein
MKNLLQELSEKFRCIAKRRCKVSTLFTASPEPRRLWTRVLKRVHPDLAIREQDRRRERLAQQANDAYAKRDEALLKPGLVPKVPPPDPLKTWAQAQMATPQHQADQPPLVPRQPPIGAGPEAFAVLWAACAVLCLLLYGILAAFKAIAGRTTCLSSLVMLTAAALWLIAKNSKLPYNHKQRWAAAVAGAMTLMGICLLSTSRGTPMFLSASAATARAVAAPVKDSGHLDLVNAHPTQTKIPSTEAIVTPARLVRGENAGSQLTGYIEAVKNSVTQKWNLSEVAAGTPAGATVYIQFAVRPRGNHDVPTVETSSGSSSLDASCLRAVNRTQTFGHFPKSYSGDRLTVLYHCTYPGSPAIKLAQDSIQPPALQSAPHVPVDGVSGAQPLANDSMVIK